jgi:hypothetical protein
MTLYTAHKNDVPMPANAGTTSWFVGEARLSIDALINGQPRGY